MSGEKNAFVPPPDYMKKHLKLKDFDKSVAVNVDDMKDTERIRQWCTMLENRTHCAATCRDFGDRVCRKALKYDHDDYCKRGEKQCKCCCQPVCKGAPEKASLLDLPGGKDGGSRSTMAAGFRELFFIPNKSILLHFHN